MWFLGSSHTTPFPGLVDENEIQTDTHEIVCVTFEY